MRRISFLVFIPFFLLLISGSVAESEFSLNVLEPVVFRADFENGSVGPWSSYPPAQDTAYDPTIWVKKVEGNNSLSLVREIDAWAATEYLFGVRKKLDIYLTAESELSFKYYIKSYSGAEKIIVKLAFADNSSKEISILVNRTMVWETVNLQIGREIISRPLRLTAIAIMAFCRQADPEAKLRLAIDDIQITGYRQKITQVRKPKIVPLEEIGVGVAKDHFVEGQRLVVETQFPVSVKKAEVTLNKNWEKVSVVQLRMSQIKGNIWQTIIPELTPGLWQAEVKGKTINGDSLDSTFIFLVKPRSFSAEHPFLLFNKADLIKIKKAIESGQTKNVWEKVRQGAADFRCRFNPEDFRYNLNAYDEIFWLPTYEGYVRALHTSSQFIRDNAIVYAISGDKEAGEAARRALISIASWPSYVHPHILNQGQFTYWPVGIALIDFAIGYDLVYDLLTPEERRTVAGALLSKGVTEVFKEYVRDNRVSSNTSNWISHVTGGGILCALAICQEYTDSELEPYLGGMIVKLREFISSTFDPDGYYGEGYYYHNFSMQSLSHTLPALKNFFSIPYPTVVKNSYFYLLYQQDRDTGRIYEFGDSHEDLIPSSMSNFAFLLTAENDPRLLWLYRQKSTENYLDLIFPVPQGTGLAPDDLPLIKRLRMVGSVIFRSGFSHEDFIFIYKCGPFYNHQHFDQGSFFLADKGELFLTECGNSNYYEDPWYPRLYIQAGGHNCPLVNGNVESQLPGDFRHDVIAWQDYARITEFLDDEEVAALSSDLTDVYRHKWQSLKRNIIYLKPRLILIQDRAKGGNGVSQLSLRFHAPHLDEIQIQGKMSKISRSGKTLWIQTLQPEIYEARTVKRPMSLHEFKAENSITMRARGFLELSTEVENGAAQFLNVLTTEGKALEALKIISGPNYLEISLGTRKFWVSKPTEQYLKTGDYETDAHILSQSAQGLLLLQAKVLKERGNLVLQADLPSGFVLKKEEHKTELKFSSSWPNRLKIWTKEKPRKVRLEPETTAEWNYEKGYVYLSLPWAEGRVLMEW